MLGEVADMRSVKMVNRKRRGKKPGTKWSRKMGRAGMLMGERDYAPVEADARWGERNRAAQAARECAERAKAERAKAERAKAERERAERENLRIADELAGVSRPLAGCSACLLVVLVVAVVCGVISFFV